MKVQIKRWGDGAAVRIPATVMEAAGFCLNQFVDIREEGGRIVVEPVGRPVYELDQLLDLMVPESFHEEADFGPPLGREAW